jgi:hypothetical protein
MFSAIATQRFVKTQMTHGEKKDREKLVKVLIILHETSKYVQYQLSSALGCLPSSPTPKAGIGCR